MSDPLYEEVEREMRAVAIRMQSANGRVRDAVHVDTATEVAVRIARNLSRVAEGAQRLSEEALAKAEAALIQERKTAFGEHADALEWQGYAHSAEKELAEERERRSKDASLSKNASLIKEALQDKSLNDFQIRIIAGLMFDSQPISEADMAWAKTLSMHKYVRCAPPPAAISGLPARCDVCGRGHDVGNPCSPAAETTPYPVHSSVHAAFVSGVAWWEWTKEGATIWSADRDKAEQEAMRRYGPWPLSPPAAEPTRCPDGFHMTHCRTCGSNNPAFYSPRLAAAERPTSQRRSGAAMSDREKAYTLSDAEFLFENDPSYCEPEMIEDLKIIILALQKENAGLQALKRSVDEALNSGDGAYRP